ARDLLGPARSTRNQRPPPRHARGSPGRRARRLLRDGGGRHGTRNRRLRRRHHKERRMTTNTAAATNVSPKARNAMANLGYWWDKVGIFAVLILLCAFMAVMAPSFLSIDNGLNVARSVSIN